MDVNGNLLSEATSRHFEWNHADRLNVFRTQTDGAEPSVHAQYLYDAAGQRVKKLIRKQGGQVEVTHYIDAVFEHHRWNVQSQAGQNNWVHITDGTGRIALVRSGDAQPDDRSPDVQFILGDHLGSSHVVLDDAGSLVNREEFTPFGETSFGSFSRKRYRFTGKERDEESALCYHDARYYHPALGKWASCDPAGLAGGLNLYTYGSNNPLCFVDGTGSEPDKFVYDADGTQIPTEVIEVNGANPFLGRYPDLDSAVNRGVDEVASWQQYKSRIMSDLGDLRSYPAWIKGMGILWQGEDAEQAHAEYERELNAKLDREYDRYLAGEAAKLDSDYRRIGGAANIVNHIAVLPIAVPAIVAGGEILAAALESRVAYAIGTAIYNSRSLLLAGTVAYGLLAPSGAPDYRVRVMISAERYEGPVTGS